MAVTSRSASYHPSSSSPFDHATGGHFAPEDIEQLYALPEGANPGRLRFTDDLENTQGRPAGAAADASGGSSPLYRSCSSGSDADDMPAERQSTSIASSGRDTQLQSALTGSRSQCLEVSSPGAAGQEALAARSMQTSRDDRVFWVPELGSQTQSFTEYTKQQMGSTLHQAAAAVHTPSLLTSTLPATSPGRASQDMLHQAQQPHAWSTPSAAASDASVEVLHAQVHDPAHTWTGSQLEAGRTSGRTSGNSMGSRWHDSGIEEGGPHPPLDPSPHSGILHATSGFRGARKEDPRLRRFREAPGAGATTASRSCAEASTASHTQRTADARSQQEHDAKFSSGQSGRLHAWDAVTESLMSDASQEQQATQVQFVEEEEKQYWRAPPSLAWAACPDVDQIRDAGNEGWAKYCSDSEESIVA